MNAQAKRAIRPAGRAVDVVVVGAGHSGLAMSRRLAEHAIDHVVLERGEVANSWRHERWDSLRLLTPNWQCRLPGMAYSGPDPDGFMSAADVASFVGRYAGEIAAPVRTATTVQSAEQTERGYRVVTDRGIWTCRGIFAASGAFSVPVLPAVASALPRSVASLSTRDYRNPSQLPDGGVLVVGASATGLQLAREIAHSGRQVTIAVGEHVRMQRTYRGRDIEWWMDRSGVLDQHYTEVDDIERARRVPSPQLIGTPERATLDLNALKRLGVRVVGRLVGIDGTRAQFSGALSNHCAMADLKLGRLLDTFDRWAAHTGLDSAIEPPSRPEPTAVDSPATLKIDLARESIGAVLWATGFRPDYSWLRVPAFDAKGRIRHAGGVVATPGVYVLGLPFLRRRKSSYIHGAADDTFDLSAHLTQFLHGRLDDDYSAVGSAGFRPLDGRGVDRDGRCLPVDPNPARPCADTRVSV